MKKIKTRNKNLSFIETYFHFQLYLLIANVYILKPIEKVKENTKMFYFINFQFNFHDFGNKMCKGKVCEDIAMKDLNRKEPVVSKKEISKLTDE